MRTPEASGLFRAGTRMSALDGTGIDIVDIWRGSHTSISALIRSNRGTEGLAYIYESRQRSHVCHTKCSLDSRPWSKCNNRGSLGITTITRTLPEVSWRFDSRLPSLTSLH